MAGEESALAMIAAYVMAGKLAQAEGRYDKGFVNCETRLRTYIAMKQKGAKRFSAACTPKTRWPCNSSPWTDKEIALPLSVSSTFARRWP